jgi:hypothetical protein
MEEGQRGRVWISGLSGEAGSEEAEKLQLSMNGMETQFYDHVNCVATVKVTDVKPNVESSVIPGRKIDVPCFPIFPHLIQVTSSITRTLSNSRPGADYRSVSPTSISRAHSGGKALKVVHKTRCNLGASFVVNRL